jgi:hypothetical protein
LPLRGSPGSRRHHRPWCSADCCVLDAVPPPAIRCPSVVRFVTLQIHQQQWAIGIVQIKFEKISGTFCGQCLQWMTRDWELESVRCWVLRMRRTIYSLVTSSPVPMYYCGWRIFIKYQSSYEKQCYGRSENRIISDEEASFWLPSNIVSRCFGRIIAGWKWERLPSKRRVVTSEPTYL